MTDPTTAGSAGAAEDITPGGPEGSGDDTSSGDVPGTDVGVGATTGEPNTFEPEEDPDAATGAR